MGRVKRFLEEKGLAPGVRVRIRRDDGLTLEGIVMPRYALSGQPYLVLKLDNGYNVGVAIDRIVSVEKLEEAGTAGTPGAPAPLVEGPLPKPEARVFVIGTGGTIASRIDYETGAVRPQLNSRELAEAIPEAFQYATIEAEEVFQLLSENMKPEHWERIAEEVYRKITSGYDGIIVAHGTDTMGYTAAALSFAFHRGLPAPVVLVGAQRSSDRPSSDAAFNFTAAVLVAARAPFAEVVVVMHGETGDTYALAHRGTRVRKMHSSRRDAFQSINTVPLARVYPYEGKIEVIDPRHRKRGEQEAMLENGFDPKVALIKFYPGLAHELIHAAVDRGFHGIVIEGTGFGHVGEEAIEAIRRAVDEGLPVVVATQTIFGRVNLNVYSTGRKMLAAGAIPVDDMLAETAYVKLSWILARTRDLGEVRSLMLTPLAGEVGERLSLRYYPKWYHGPAR